MLFNFTVDARVLPAGCLLSVCVATSAIAGEVHTFQAKTPSLAQLGQAIQFHDLPAGNKSAGPADFVRGCAGRGTIAMFSPSWTGRR